MRALFLLKRSTLSVSSISFLRLSETACLVAACDLSLEDEISAEILIEEDVLTRVGISRLESETAVSTSLFWFNLPQKFGATDQPPVSFKLADKVLVPRTINLDGFLTRFFPHKTAAANFFETVFRVLVPGLGLLQHQKFVTLLRTFCERHVPGQAHSFQSRDLTRGIIRVKRHSKRKPRCRTIALIGDNIGITRPSDTLPVSGKKDESFLYALDASIHLAQARFCILVLDDAILVASLSAHAYQSTRELLHAVFFHQPDVAAALYAAASNKEQRHIDRASASLPSKISVSVSIPNQLRFEIQTAVPLDTGLFLAGWYVDPSGTMKMVEVADYSLEDPQIDKAWVTFKSHVTVEGRDFYVDRFVAFLPRKAKRKGPTRPAVLMTTFDEDRHILAAPLGSSDPTLQRKAIIDQVDERSLDLTALTKSFLPAVQALQNGINQKQIIEREVIYSQFSKKKVSIVIPIYRNIDFIKHQLFSFYSDVFIRENCEIIYVNDDPAYGRDLQILLEGYKNLINLNVRLVLLAQNGGYALANNIAAKVAVGEILVLMNSDIVPEASSWLEGMVARLEDLPPYSAVGPKLLYADDTLQHAGMYFLRHFSGFWQNMHYYKGYGRNFPPADEERIVGAVTGACIVVRKVDFLDVGGFSTDYVIGDYEDSDLCFKLRQKGGVCVYTPRAALYHFERQSMQVNTLRNDSTTSAFNRALHFLKWKDSGLEAGYLQE